MKKPVPGHIHWVNGHMLWFAKRTDGCKGCIYENNLILCPDVVTKNNNARINCALYRVILVKY